MGTLTLPLPINRERNLKTKQIAKAAIQTIVIIGAVCMYTLTAFVLCTP